MTEAEWLACNYSLRRPFHFLGTRAGDRKRRLFAVACCRRIEELILRFKGAWRAVVLAERIADGQPVSDEAIQLRRELPGRAFCWIDGYREEKENNVMWNAASAAAGCLAGIDPSPPFWSMPGSELLDVADHASWAAGHQARRNDREPRQHRAVEVEMAAQMQRFHCIFGNPFRPIAFSPDWRTDTAIALARQMYEARDFGAMPILADALQDAGCTSEDVLAHCRGASATHVRGCWVVDLVLGKE